jgi:hypothetical protein
LFIAGAAAVLVRRQQPMMYIPVEDRRDPLRPFPLLQPGRSAAR